MVDRWFSGIELPLTFEQFLRLPTNPAYKYEYFGGAAHLSPRPKECHVLLELRARGDDQDAPVDPLESVRIRPLAASDWDPLGEVFAGAFHRVQPFASLGDAQRLEAGRQCLQFTREGGDGPLIERACFAAVETEDDRPCGAILVTLLPDRDLSETFDLRWKEPPPADWAERRIGRPHLTWIFVGHWSREHGIGSALLAAATEALLGLGYRALASTFLVGNEASALWHWRNGFQLSGRPYSWRRIHARTRP
jgi:hypothetical protein